MLRYEALLVLLSLPDLSHPPYSRSTLDTIRYTPLSLISTIETIFSAQVLKRAHTFMINVELPSLNYWTLLIFCLNLSPAPTAILSSENNTISCHSYGELKLKMFTIHQILATSVREIWRTRISHHLLKIVTFALSWRASNLLTTQP